MNFRAFLVFLLFCTNAKTTRAQTNDSFSGIIYLDSADDNFDTLYFADIYDFQNISNDKFLSLKFDPSWQKYFLPRIITKEHYLSMVLPLAPEYLLCDKGSVLPLAQKNFLNLDQVHNYTKIDLQKIFFLGSIPNVLLYSFAKVNSSQNFEMQYFALIVQKQAGIWNIKALPIPEKKLHLTESMRVVFAHATT